MTVDRQPANDPSHSSYYVTDAYYQTLIDAFGAFDRAEPASDPALLARATALLLKEARFLDTGRLDDWLALFQPECAYWIPATAERGDPRREIAITFDDRRRLEDRVYRLRTGFAWSQLPETRTVRAISNVEIFPAPAGGDWVLRSTFTLHAFRDGDRQTWAGWNAHLVADTTAGLSVVAKQVNLIDCDQNLRNPSFVL